MNEQLQKAEYDLIREYQRRELYKDNPSACLSTITHIMGLEQRVLNLGGNLNDCMLRAVRQGEVP